MTRHAVIKQTTLRELEDAGNDGLTSQELTIVSDIKIEEASNMLSHLFNDGKCRRERIIYALEEDARGPRFRYFSLSISRGLVKSGTAYKRAKQTPPLRGVSSDAKQPSECVNLPPNAVNLGEVTARPTYSPPAPVTPAPEFKIEAVTVYKMTLPNGNTIELSPEQYKQATGG